MNATAGDIKSYYREWLDSMDPTGSVLADPVDARFLRQVWYTGAASALSALAERMNLTPDDSATVGVSLHIAAILKDVAAENDCRGPAAALGRFIERTRRESAGA